MRIVTRRSFNLLTKNLFNKVETKVQNKIGFIYMNSQKDFNSLSQTMKASLSKTVREFDNHPDVKVIVLLSLVKKAFCAGANIKQFQGKTSKDFEHNDIFKEIHNSFYQAKKPIIAGVNGVALGGGFQLALLCDVIVCSQDARFALPQLKLGLIPGIGGTQRLAKIAGRVNAMRYVLTSQFIKAQRAYELGVVSDVFKTQQLHAKTIQIAQQMTHKPLPALLAAKDAIKATENMSMEHGIAHQRKIFYPLYDTQGFKQGVSAFIEKRKPNLHDL